MKLIKEVLTTWPVSGVIMGMIMNRTKIKHTQVISLVILQTEYDEKCAKCHSDQTAGYATTLHHGIGQKDKVTKRSGLSGHAQFDDLPAHQIEGYNANCATCHGTCGNCHVVRPPIAGGGLPNGHQFTKTPDMRDVCVSCHTSRGGHAYYGWDEMQILMYTGLLASHVLSAITGWKFMVMEKQ